MSASTLQTTSRAAPTSRSSSIRGTCWKTTTSSHGSVSRAGREQQHAARFYRAEHATHDGLPENSLMYAKTMHLAGAATPALHMYPFGGHGFGVCAELDPVGGFEMFCEWPSHALRYLQYIGMAPSWPANITNAWCTTQCM